jgi:hypothetical protein
MRVGDEGRDGSHRAVFGAGNFALAYLTGIRQCARALANKRI